MLHSTWNLEEYSELDWEIERIRKTLEYRCGYQAAWIDFKTYLEKRANGQNITKEVRC